MSKRQTIAETIATGQSSFFRLAPGIDPRYDAVLIGVPLDTGTSYRPGARFGPYGVRKASMALGEFDHQGRSVFREFKVTDGGNLVCTPFDLVTAQAQIRQQALPLFGSGAAVLAVGGDHSATFPLLQAAAEVYGGVSVIHFDAHSDTTSAESWGTPFHHGTVFRNAIDAGCIRPGRFVQIGLRGPFGEEAPHAFTRGFGGEVYEADSFDTALWRLSELTSEWAADPVYISIDIDVIDPAFAPGTGTPVSGGLTPRELFRALRLLNGLQIVGFDVMEIAPDYDCAEITSVLAAHLLFEGLSLVAASKLHPAAGESPTIPGMGKRE